MLSHSLRAACDSDSAISMLSTVGCVSPTCLDFLFGHLADPRATCQQACVLADGTGWNGSSRPMLCIGETPAKETGLSTRKNCSCTPAIRDATLGLMQARKGGVRASPYAMQRVCGGGRQGRRHRRELWSLCGGIRRRLAGLAGMGMQQPSAGGYPALGNDVSIAVRPRGRTLQMERYGTVYSP